VRDDYFTKYFYPTDFSSSHANFSVTDTDNIWSCITLANAITTVVCYATFRRPYLWVNGNYTVETWYTVEDTNSIDYKIRMWGIAEGADLATGVTALVNPANQTLSVGTAGLLARNTIEATTTPILADYDLVALKLFRQTTSTSTADFKILQVTIQYHPLNPQ
jgi:hypothetical protein